MTEQTLAMIRDVVAESARTPVEEPPVPALVPPAPVRPPRPRRRAFDPDAGPPPPRRTFACAEEQAIEPPRPAAPRVSLRRILSRLLG